MEGLASPRAGLGCSRPIMPSDSFVSIPMMSQRASRPSFDFQAWYPNKFRNVTRYENETTTQGVGRDQRIEWSDRLVPQRRPETSIFDRSQCVEVEDALESGYKEFNLAKVLGHLLRVLGTVLQFRQNDARNAQLLGMAVESSGNSGRCIGFQS